MKRIIISVLVLLTWNVSSFGQDKKPAIDKKYDPTIYTADSHNKAKLDKLSQEAVDLAKKRMASFIVKCGKNVYISPKPVDVSVVRGSISEADKMNGLEWAGIVSFTILVPYQSASHAKEYEEWINGPFVYSRMKLEKKNGIWKYPPGQPTRPFTCDEALNPTGFWGDPST
ncbi:MAG: hypothetical protein HW377_1095 [Actinobacteria bacterium]|nr:hypothetical protein [Actinomycetota bacterium]